MHLEMKWRKKERRQLVLVDVNICFLGSEALQKLQAPFQIQKPVSYAYGDIWSRKN